GSGGLDLIRIVPGREQQSAQHDQKRQGGKDLPFGIVQCRCELAAQPIDGGQDRHTIVHRHPSYACAAATLSLAKGAKVAHASSAGLPNNSTVAAAMRGT